VRIIRALNSRIASVLNVCRAFQISRQVLHKLVPSSSTISRSSRHRDGASLLRPCPQPVGARRSDAWRQQRSSVRTLFFFFDNQAGMPLLMRCMWVKEIGQLGKPPPSPARAIMMTCPLAEAKREAFNARISLAIGQSARKPSPGHPT
jgi:hypothetical protein